MINPLIDLGIVIVAGSVGMIVLCGLGMILESWLDK